MWVAPSQVGRRTHAELTAQIVYMQGVGPKAPPADPVLSSSASSSTGPTAGVPQLRAAAPRALDGPPDAKRFAVAKTPSPSTPAEPETPFVAPMAALPIAHVEAVEVDPERHPHHWAVAVQWHPEERPDDLRLFAGLVAAATSYATQKTAQKTAQKTRHVRPAPPAT